MSKKSLKDISWLVDEPTYRADEALSFSSISKFYREGFSKLDQLFDKEESQALSFGSMVDCLMTEGEEEFNKRYFVCTIPLISDDYKLVVTAIKEELGNIHSSLYDIPSGTIVSYLDRFGIYQNNWKVETKADKIREGANTYYKMMIKAGDKEIVSTEMAQDAKDCAEAFKTSEATEFFFREDNPFDGIERLHQLKFKGEYNGVKLRCMIDLLVVDHNKKIIYIKDVKTTGDQEYQFAKSFMKWQYWMQAQIYTYILKQNLAKDEYFKDFKVLDFGFLVINKTNKIPLNWVFNQANCENDLVIEGKTRNVYLPNWRQYAVDLDCYLKLRPKTPKNISPIKENSITEALKEW